MLKNSVAHGYKKNTDKHMIFIEAQSKPMKCNSFTLSTPSVIFDGQCHSPGLLTGRPLLV